MRNLISLVSLIYRSCVWQTFKMLRLYIDTFSTGQKLQNATTKTLNIKVVVRAGNPSQDPWHRSHMRDISATEPTHCMDCR